MKPWYLSRTIWFNIAIAAVSAAIGVIAQQPDIGIAGPLLSGVNVWLRSRTTTSLTS